MTAEKMVDVYIITEEGFMRRTERNIPESEGKKIVRDYMDRTGHSAFMVESVNRRGHK